MRTRLSSGGPNFWCRCRQVQRPSGFLSPPLPCSLSPNTWLYENGTIVLSARQDGVSPTVSVLYLISPCCSLHKSCLERRNYLDVLNTKIARDTTWDISTWIKCISEVKLEPELVCHKKWWGLWRQNISLLTKTVLNVPLCFQSFKS